MGDRLFFVFDVESVGLHGEGFAVGWVVVDRLGRELHATQYACPPERAEGTEEGREWVSANVPPLCYNCQSPLEVRDQLWDAIQEAKRCGVSIVADCAWPVESRMLMQAASERDRHWTSGPYPLHDLASIRLAAGIDPVATVDRTERELPQHDPLADARQSARLLIHALSAIAAD